MSQTAEQFNADMATVADKITALVPEALRDCEPLVSGAIMENFLGSKSPDGTTWPPRKNPGDGHPLLIETGALMLAATTPGTAGHVSRVEGDSLVVGVDKDGGIGGIPGAGVHNYGFAERNVPQREFMGIDEDTADACGEVIADKLLGGLL